MIRIDCEDVCEDENISILLCKSSTVLYCYVVSCTVLQISGELYWESVCESVKCAGCNIGRTNTHTKVAKGDLLGDRGQTAKTALHLPVPQNNTQRK